MTDRNWESEFLQMQRRYNESQKLVKAISNAKDQLQIKYEVTLAQLENCERQVGLQKTINQNLMTEMNQKNNAYAGDLHRLEEEVNKLKKRLKDYDTFDKLGY